MDFQREGKKTNYFEGMLFERTTTREGMNKQKCLPFGLVSFRCCFPPPSGRNRQGHFQSILVNFSRLFTHFQSFLVIFSQFSVNFSQF